MKVLATSQMATVKANGLCNLLSGGWKAGCLAFKAILQ